MKIKRGSTSVRRLIFVADSSSTTGAGLANLAYNTSSLVAYYFAGDLSNEVAITLATATLGTWTSGGFVAVDNTNMPGWYEIGIPDAALDGGNECAIQLRGAANMVPVNIHIELDAFDYQTATQPVNVTQFGGTNGTFTSGKPTVELDSDAQTQLQAIEDGVDAGNNYHVSTLARLGAWTGTGINNVLGAIRALAAKLPGLTPTDLSTGTTFNNTAHSLEATAIAGAGAGGATLERNPADTGVITFAWPVSGATITGEVSIDNAAYIPVAGNIAFLREDAGKYYYTLSHDVADRPTASGSARYTFTDGEYTKYVILRVVESGDTGEATALAVLCLDWETITGEVPSRSTLNALRHIRNKWALDGDIKTVYAEDNTTPAYTTTVTADGAGNITADTPN